jgi:hypothetical protein
LFLPRARRIENSGETYRLKRTKDIAEEDEVQIKNSESSKTDSTTGTKL